MLSESLAMKIVAATVAGVLAMGLALVLPDALQKILLTCLVGIPLGTYIVGFWSKLVLRGVTLARKALAASARPQPVEG